MSYDTRDTICAIATAAGGAARGIVRISGEGASTIVARMFVPDNAMPLVGVRLPTAISGRLRFEPNNSRESRLAEPSSVSGSIGVPCDLFMWPTSRSFSREPVAELNMIGSVPVLEATIAFACAHGARLAQPGEFTLRAFLAGRIDLTQAEAVLGVIEASGGDELHVALRQLAGGLARPLDQLRNDLVQLLAELEAGLDFVEEDIRFISQAEVLRRLQSALESLDSVSEQIQFRHSSMTPEDIALVGPPNAGKSSLFNALVKRYQVSSRIGTFAMSAIVSDQRGTTRDYLVATISVDSLQCRLIDTAGVDPYEILNASKIDTQAQSHALERRKRATVRAYCISATEQHFELTAEGCDLVVITKSDLATSDRVPFQSRWKLPVVVTSSHNGDGLGEFCSAVRSIVTRESQPCRGAVIDSTAARCAESIRLAASAVNRAVELVHENAGDELIAAELRAALAELGKVVGTVYTDDLLDRIFKTFCVGK